MKSPCILLSVRNCHKYDVYYVALLIKKKKNMILPFSKLSFALENEACMQATFF